MSDDEKRGPDTQADDVEETTADKPAADDKPAAKPAADDKPAAKPAADDKPAKKAAPKSAKKKTAAPKTTTKKKPASKPAATVKTKAVGTKKAAEPAKPEKKAPASSEPLPEDETADQAEPEAKAESQAKAPAKEPAKEPAKAEEAPVERPRTEPPPVPPHYRSRHPQPPPTPSGGGGRVVLLVVAVIALVFVILSLANSRSYQIVEQDGQAVLSKGYFLPAGTRGVIPEGGATAFTPIPWITPPQGSVTRGNLKDVTTTYYALLYLEAGEAMEDDAAFDEYDQQAAGLEAWYHDRFGVYPEATDKMHDLRFRVRNRRSATKEFLEQRDVVLEQMEALISSVPEHSSPAVLEDVARFEAFLAEERATSF